MNKKLIALAVAGVFALPVAAMADSGNVKISGKIDMSVDSLNGANTLGTDNTRQTNVSNSSSNIRFGGSEDLGNGLKAFWQVGNFVNMGSGGANGWASDDSFVGLKGNFGSVRLGKMASPMKMVSRKLDLFGNHIGDSRNLLSAPENVNINKASLGTGNLWDLRTNNTVAYQTPNFSGLTANVSYSTNRSASAAANSQSIDGWSANGIYKNGPIFAAVAYERHNDSNLGAGVQNSHAWRLGGGYKFGPAKVVALYQKATDMGGYSGASRNVWGLGGAYKMGANALKIQYYASGDTKVSGMNSADTGAKMWALGVDHHMSKRTTLYVAYARTNNDSNAAYSAFGAGHGDNPGTVMGKNPSGFSLGMIHKF